MRVLAFLLLASSVTSFAPSVPSVSRVSSATELSASRRELLGSALVSSIMLVGSSAALADVADGNQLPSGAAQFSRLIRIKADIVGVKQRLSDNPADIDKKEWTNIGSFLRRIYAMTDDMKFVGNSLVPDKKKQGQEIAEQLRKYSKGGESGINEQDAKALIAVLDKCDSLFQDFFDLLYDVPDEI